MNRAYLARAGAVAVLVAASATRAEAATKATTADSIRYAVAITDIHRVGLTVTNYGFFGNNFTSRTPSFEFPLGSGFEHMARAGLWVGARALSDTGFFNGVSTGIVDNAQGSAQQSETEFTPAGTTITQRSRISNNAFYSPAALSDQDYTCSYSDQPGHLPVGNQHERHTPLGILVKQRTLAFSLPAADAFVVAQFTIVNQGPPLTNVWVGLYAQLVSGDRDAYSTWPPSANGSAGSWYYKTHVEYDAARRLYKERYCASLPYPNGCNIAYCPPWSGVQLLSVTPDSIPDKTVSFNSWSFSPDDTTRDTDVERYRLLGNGHVDDLSTCIPGGSCSPIIVLSVGPFASIDPGDSIRVDFAFVGGEDEASLLQHADFAQFASDIDYELPAPPPSPRLLVEPGDHRLDLYWDASPEDAVDPTSPAPGGKDFEGYRVYIGLDRGSPTRVAQFDQVDTTGFNTGLDSLTTAPPRILNGVSYPYHYAVTGLRDGFNYFGAVTSFDVGDANVTSLESGLGQNKFQAVPSPRPGEHAGGPTVFPNPYRVEARWDQGQRVRDHYLWFARLPRRCVIRIYTLAGAKVFETRFDGDTYRGQSARGLYDPRQDRDVGAPYLSGSSFAWDLITDQGQAIASGVYLFAVEDLETGGVSRGKFLVVKSDRED